MAGRDVQSSTTSTVLSVIERALAGETGRYFDGDHVSETEASASRRELQARVRQRALELSARYRE